MWKHNLNLAFRHLKRKQGYSLLNIFGFAVSIASFLLVTIFVNHELSYDRYHSNTDKIYRASAQLSDDVTWVPLNGDRMEAIAPDIPEIETFVRFDPGWNNSHHMTYGDKEFFEDLKAFYWTDSSVFDVFDIDLILGDKTNALHGPGSIILSQRAVQKYFGNENPMGKILKRAKREDYLVKGVFKDIPGNSHLKFDFLATNSGMRQSWAYTYFLTNRTLPTEYLEQKINAGFKRHFSDEGSADDQEKLIVQALPDIHLDSHFEYETEVGGNRANVWALAVTGFLILAVGLVNFINMFTAKSTLRGKEVGVRKAIGSSRNQLIGQFYTEAFVFASLSIVLALMLVFMTWPFYLDIIGRELAVPALSNIAGLMLLFLVVTVFIAGSYPALLLSSFRTVQVLKGVIKSGKGAARFRRALVCMQFMASIFLISGIMIVFLQLKYFNEKSLGFKKEQLVSVVGDMGAKDVTQSKAKLIKDRWMNHPNINQVAKSRGVPTKLDWINLDRIYPEGISTETEIRSVLNKVDHSFLRTLRLEVIAGRDFSEELDAGEQPRVLINQTAAKMIGWDNPVGKKLDFVWNQRVSATVIGVVKDHHTQSLHVPVSPQIFYLWEGVDYFYWTIQLGDGDPLQTLGYLEDIWNETMTLPFDHFFIDQIFDQQYQADRRFAKVFGSFTLLAVLICGLGLLALTTFTTQQRMKEIGVRKVLGSSVKGIVLLLSKDIFVLILIAFLVSGPIAFLVMQKWLDGFAYSIHIPAWVFGLTLVLAIVLAMISTFWQSFKAGRTNPVTILKSE